MFDDVDRQVVAALFSDPRASWEKIGEQTSVSANTVSRRVKRLQDNGELKIVGEIPWGLFSDTFPVHLWIQVSGSHIRRVLDSLSNMPETQHVAALLGRCQIFCTLFGRNEIHLLELIDDIQSIKGVAQISAYPVIKPAVKASGWRPHIYPNLLSNHADTFSPVLLETGERRVNIPLNDTERGCLRLLQLNGRLSATDLARNVEISVPTAHRILARLIGDGFFRPRVECNLQNLGFNCTFLLRIEVKPEYLVNVLNRIAQHPAFRLVAQIAGDSDIFATGVAADRSALAEIINNDLAKIDGIYATSSDIIARDWKRFWTLYADNGSLGSFTPIMV